MGSRPESIKRAFSDLVRFDEADEHGEEHGGRRGFRVLSKVLHGRVVRVLQETESSTQDLIKRGRVD